MENESLIKIFKDLAEIPSPSGQEGRVRDYIIDVLKKKQH